MRRLRRLGYGTYRRLDAEARSMARHYEMQPDCPHGDSPAFCETCAAERKISAHGGAQSEGVDNPPLSAPSEVSELVDCS